jgi:putative ABC transport system permease protein
MLQLALSTVRARKGAFAGAFVALVLATTLIAACGILVETGTSARLPVERHAATALVVAGSQRLAVPDTDGGEGDYELLAERVRVDSALVDRIQQVGGVRAAIGEVTFPAHVVTASGAVLQGPRSRYTSDGAAGGSWGHAWDSAALTPFVLAEGQEPTGSDEVVMDAELARRANVQVGDEVGVQATAAPRVYRVAGIAVPRDGDGLVSQSTLFFSAAEAGRLTGIPGRVDAIGVLAEPGVDVASLRERVSAALQGSGTRVLAGDDRGAAEFIDAASAREELVELSGSFGGTALLVALFVVASTFALQVQQRAREIALLRAVAATPRQVRRMICREAQVVAMTAGIVGALPAAALAGWLRAQFVDHGLLPDAFPLQVGPLPVLVALAAGLGTAWLAAWVAARRASRIRPTEALGEAAVERKRMSAGRLIAGLVVLALSVTLLVLSRQFQGEAVAASGAVLILALVTAAALLSPILARMAASVLGGPLQLLSRTTGYLAVANTRANSRRLGSAITPLILAVALGGGVLFQQTTIGHAAARQAREGLLADRVVVADAGLPRDMTPAIQDVPGVAAATAVVQTDVVVEYTELGEPVVQSFSAQGVTPRTLGNTIDLGIRTGSLEELGDGTVAVSRLAAGTIGAEVGERLPLRLGDGARIEPRVVAIYDRGLGFGDFVLPRSMLDGHLTDPLDHAVLVRLANGAKQAQVDASLADLPYAGLAITDRAGFQAAQADAMALEAWVNFLLIGVLLGYVAISVTNSLVMGTHARARELALLRLVGTTRRQVLGMMRWEGAMIVVTATLIGVVIAGVALVMISLGMTGSPVPYVPPVAGVALLAGVAALGMAAIMLPTRYALRSNPAEAIGMRE